MIDVGAYHDPRGASVGKVKDNVFRRLHALTTRKRRFYFAKARANGDLEGINEVALYLPQTLQGLVETYGDGGDDGGDEE